MYEFCGIDSIFAKIFFGIFLFTFFTTLLCQKRIITKYIKIISPDYYQYLQGEKYERSIIGLRGLATGFDFLSGMTFYKVDPDSFKFLYFYFLLSRILLVLLIVIGIALRFGCIG